ncbi:MAG: flavodoxin family protein [Ignavibacteriales bacterium]|nr:flavodoxin family protein [Ignavibacteriales bacterium]
MKKVTAFVGSARKQHTYNAVRQFLSSLESLGDIESEIVRLSECNLETCKGCKLCFEKGEEFCQFKDDRDLLIQKMMASDGVVFASPNYSFQVSGIMKGFLDRLGFVFHRPRFFGKVFTSIVVQGIYGGPKIVQYLDFVGNGLGFNVVNGICLTSLEPITDEARRKNDSVLKAQSRIFFDRLSQRPYPVPSLLKLMIFRMSRKSIGLMLNDSSRDYTYYRDKGWFESDYFYPVPLNLFKKAIGTLFDYTASRIAKR